MSPNPGPGYPLTVFAAGMLDLLRIALFVNAPNSVAFIAAVELLSDDRCHKCGYRWQTGRHGNEWHGIPI